ncbi:GntR family transcriptional regulator [Desulfosporosinus sp. SB140]|uniref:GntR family transcriptional regulator n=1 Tax=Desulfosporosinus paludis TaxID=3115649 RepID=UPI00388F779D
MELKANSQLPLHVQIKDCLKNEILQGNLERKIPSEKELMDIFSVSRTTIREAIGALDREGVVKKIHGKGTFVTLRPIQEQWMGNISTFSETIERAGMKPGAKLISKGIKSSPQFISDMFGGQEYYVIERLRTANDRIMAVERKCFEVGIGLKLENYDLNSNIYKLLEFNIGIKPWTAKEVVTSNNPSKEDAALLGIPKASSVLVIERSTWDPEGVLIEFVSTIFRADKYSVNINMSRH